MWDLIAAWVRRFGWAAVADTAIAVLTSFGALWVCVEILSFFFKSSPFVDWVARNWWAFLVAGVAIGVFRTTRPIGATISDTDIRVEIRVGNLFSRRFDGALVVGSNATFDTSIEDGSIAPDSVQGQFTKRYFRDSVGDLDQRLGTSLAPVALRCTHTRAGKAFGKCDEYDLGTMAKVEAVGKTAYFVAISRLNENKVAESNLSEYLDALPVMWEGIRSRGGQDAIVCPVLGTGYSRLPLNRMNAIRVLVRSFVAAAREGKLAERLTVVVAPRDVAHLDLGLLNRWLECECTHRGHTGFATPAGPVGTAA